jgi:hypothetical protein
MRRILRLQASLIHQSLSIGQFIVGIIRHQRTLPGPAGQRKRVLQCGPLSA